MTTVELNALSSEELVRRMVYARLAGRVSRKEDPLRLRFAARNEAVRIKKILAQRGDLPCPDCRGAGEVLKRGTACPECRGQGFFTKDDSEIKKIGELVFKKCKACDGWGYEMIREQCTRCGGTGRVGTA